MVARTPRRGEARLALVWDHQVYDVWAMRRTNIYLDDRQLDVLRRLGEQRSAAVSELIREAVDAWLAAQGVRMIEEGEWQRRFGRLLDRRREVAERLQPPADQVERDVTAAVAEVRRAGSARRR